MSRPNEPENEASADVQSAVHQLKGVIDKLHIADEFKGVETKIRVVFPSGAPVQWASVRC